MKNSLKISPRFFLLFAITLLLVGCGGDSGSDDGSNFIKYEPETLLTGTFVDAPVKGLRYKTKTQNGYTDEKGQFQYKKNEYIAFYLGDLYLGRVQAKKLITPYTLGGGSPAAPSTKATNIAILLQNCDNHASSAYIDVEKLKDHRFDNATSLDDPSNDFINELQNNENITVTVDKQTAQKNLNDTLGYKDEKFVIPPISEKQKKAFLDAVNNARAHQQDCGEYGMQDAVPALTWNDKLYKAAYTYNYDMVHGNAWHHVGSNTDSDIVAKTQHLGRGSYMRDRIEYFNYNFYYIGENIAKGYRTLDDVIQGWLDSDGHCKNLMDPHFTELGMSLMLADDKYGKYWTQDFGEPRQ